MYRMRTSWVLGLTGLSLLFLAPPLVSQETTSPQPAYLRVRLPANAELLVDGTRTRQKGPERLFESPPLAQGTRYVYNLKATWKENGKEVVREERARVRAGQETVVDFLQPTGKEERAVPEATPKKEEATPETPPKKEAKPSEPPAPKPQTNTPPAKETPAADKQAAQPRKPKRAPDIFFLPTPQPVVNRMLELANIKKGDVVYDLGCGDGRIVVTAAEKYGVKAFGFDIDPERVDDSRANVKKHHVQDLVKIEEKDIFELDLRPATVVTLYLLPELNEKLMPQLSKLKPGSRIVSHDFPMDGAKPEKVETLKVKDDMGVEHDHTIYLWVVPWKMEK
jgi:uncharacterized protein (TIGR03000 family)